MSVPQGWGCSQPCLPAAPQAPHQPGAFSSRHNLVWSKGRTEKRWWLWFFIGLFGFLFVWLLLCEFCFVLLCLSHRRSWDNVCQWLEKAGDILGIAAPCALGYNTECSTTDFIFGGVEWRGELHHLNLILYLCMSSWVYGFFPLNFFFFFFLFWGG